MILFFFDTETNGLHGSSCLEFYGKKIFFDDYDIPVREESFHRFYFPHEGKFNYFAQRVHGIDHDIVCSRRGFCDYAEYYRDDNDIYRFIEEVDVMIGHNLNFDMQYIDREKIKKNIDFFDTMVSNKNILKLPSKRGFKFPKLVELAEFYEIYHNPEDFHGAEYDVNITVDVFF